MNFLYEKRLKGKKKIGKEEGKQRPGAGQSTSHCGQGSCAGPTAHKCGATEGKLAASLKSQPCTGTSVDKTDMTSVSKVFTGQKEI